MRNVTCIGDYAFAGCNKLTSVNIPNSVISIGEYAFQDCESLTSIIIPNSVKSIGEGAFKRCIGLTLVSIPNTVTSIEAGTFFYCINLTLVTIPNSIKSIGDYAFGGCSGLTSITIPKSVKNINSQAFAKCSGLDSAFIPNSVTYMGYGAFSECDSVTIYCESRNEPNDWQDDWNLYGYPVVWGANNPIWELYTTNTASSANTVNIYANNNTIVVENATDEIRVYDAMGRLVWRAGRDVARNVSTITINKTGVYIVKTGNTAKRVML